MTIPGYCECGCGERTALSKYNDKRWGDVKGKPRRFVHNHHTRGSNHYAWNEGRTTSGGYVGLQQPDHPRASPDGYVFEHILVAEKALGRLLPEGAVLHHVNEDRADNRPENLVICQDRAYHNGLHQRMRARAACGHADWRKCSFCGEWDDPENMYVDPTVPRRSAFHRECRNRTRKRRKGNAPCA